VHVLTDGAAAEAADRLVGSGFAGARA